MNLQANRGARARASRSAFTLVELLVVIAIIGILIALLLPAVQAAREGARRMTCSNHLKQCGLALHNYHDVHNTFPPNALWPAGRVNDGDNNSGNTGPTWIIMILPFLESETLYDQFNLKQSICAPANRKPRGTRLEFVRCPSDSFNELPFNGSKSVGTAAYNDGWARGNYAANSGLAMYSDSAHCGDIVGGAGCVYNASSPAWKAAHTKGVMGPNCACRIRDISDGTAKTIMLCEIRAGLTEYDVRGVWALAGAGVSSLAAHGYFGDARGPNPFEVLGDDSAGCTTLAANFPPEYIAMMGMGCCPTDGSAMNRQASARSSHGGGVNACFADGSVHFVGDFVEVGYNASPEPYLGIWDRLNLSMDGKEIGPGTF